MSGAAPVNRILRSGIVDGPGNRAVVFMQGCNFDCVYCHNPETISLCVSCGNCLSACPSGALGRTGGRVQWKERLCVHCDACLTACPHNSSPRVKLMKAEAVMKEIEKALPFIRGITVSGGECTLYPVFLCELGEMAREKGLTFFLDTNGSFYFSERKPEKASRGAWDDAARLFERTDAVMLDLKADPDNPEEHRRVTGRGGYDILAQAEFLGRAGKLYELRTVVSPGLFDAAALVDKACRRMAGIDPRLQYRLIRYRPVGVRPAEAAELSVPDDHLMEKLAGICRDHGIKAVVV